MKAYREGDRSQGICRRCESLVDTQFKVRDYTLPESGKRVPSLLVAVCDRCDEVVAIPAQSTPRLREAQEGGAA